MFDIARVTTKVRLLYHAYVVSIANAAKQLHILTDEEAEELNKKHRMVIFTDIIPRLKDKDEA